MTNLISFSFASKSLGLLGASLLALVVGCNDSNTIGSLPAEDNAPQEMRSNNPYNSAPSVLEANYQTVITGVNDFGLDVFRRKATASDKNIVLSPVSLNASLAMAYAGAAGETAAQMKTVLRDPFGDTTYHDAMNQLTIELRSRELAPTSVDKPLSIDLSLLNAVWFQKELGILAPFLDVLATSYDAGVRLADFTGNSEGARQAINQFASNATKGKITDLIGPSDLDASTQVVLANALYLKASWAEPFVANNTAAGDFRLATNDVVSVPMMHANKEMGYYSGANFEAVDLAYVGGNLSMLVVLPGEGQFAAVRDALNASLVQTVTTSLAKSPVNLSLPKFSMTWGTESFNAELSAMGMPNAFTSAADFSGVSATPLYIGKVLQKAFVGVDESGTEAAAASATTMLKAAIIQPVATVNVNRPFFFAIHDKNGSLLFVGQVTDPS